MLSKYHGKREIYDGRNSLSFRDKLPKRSEFVDKEISNEIKRKIAGSEPIMFMPNQTVEIYTKTKLLKSELMLIGITRDGSKAAVILQNIKIFIDVKVPDDVEDAVDVESVIAAQLKSEKIFVSKTKIVYLTAFAEDYNPNKVPYIRMFFNTISQRKKAIVYLGKNDIEMPSNMGKRRLQSSENDDGSHYRKIAREYKIPLGAWNTVSNYTLLSECDNAVMEKFEYVFNVDVKNFVAYVPKEGAEEIPGMKKDRLMIQTWDIETDDMAPNGSAPDPRDVFGADGRERAIIQLDCCTFHWHYDQTVLLAVAISAFPTPRRDDCMVIQVKNQMELIEVKAILTGRMAPEYLVGFNDGQYDWPFINERITAYDAKLGQKYYEDFVLEEMSVVPMSVYRNETTIDRKRKYTGCASETRIKIDAETSVDNEVFKAHGFICLDVRTLFRQMHPSAEASSLNFFLAQNKIPPKEDMDYVDMFKVFRLMRHLASYFKTRSYKLIEEKFAALAAEKGDDWMPFASGGILSATQMRRMREVREAYSIKGYNIGQLRALFALNTQVVKYCWNDAARCQALMQIRNVVPDKREIANLSYTSMHDAFFRAGGMKVRNLVMAYGCSPQWNYAFNVYDPHKYTGGSTTGGKGKSKKKYPGAYVVPPKKGLFKHHKFVNRARCKRIEQNPALADDAEIGNIIEIPPGEVDPQSEEFDQELRDDAAFDDMAGKPGYDRIDTDPNFTARPCVGLDFSSLYPSLAMTYNFSPEMFIDKYKGPVDVRGRRKINTENVERAKQLEADGVKLHFVSFRYGLPDQAEETKELVEGWFVQYKPIRPKDPKDWPNMDKWTFEGIGIYPSILKRLFGMRNIVKKSMGYYAIPKEFLDKISKDPQIAEYLKRRYGDEFAIRKRIRELLHEEQEIEKAKAEEHKGTAKFKYYDRRYGATKLVEKFLDAELKDDIKYVDFYADVAFNYNYYNAKQLALKLYMNTFYGEAGNSLSQFFKVAVAGGITTAGQANIQKVKAYVEKRGYNVLYGDTDSLYICSPEAVFKEVDAEYESGAISRLEYWTRMVEITMENVTNFAEEVNGFLMEDNGTPFLTMAYEEVLFPYMFLGKKKYFGIGHVGIVNFSAVMPDCSEDDFVKSRTLFIRGLEMKKRGSSAFLKKACNEPIQRAFCVDTVQTLKETVESHIHALVRRTWKPEMFIRTARYRLPGKKETGETKRGNVVVKLFADRMKDIELKYPELGIKEPELGERFNYIVARKYPFVYDIKGLKSKIKVGERYEYFTSLTNAEYNRHLGAPLEIDMDYYMEGEVSGQYARLISYHPIYDRFLGAADLDDDDAVKAADKKAAGAAKKALKTYYSNKYGKKYEDRSAYYKAIFKNVNNAYADVVEDEYGDIASILKIASSVGLAKDNDSVSTSALEAALIAKAESETTKKAEKGIAKEVRDLIAKLGKNGLTQFQMKRLYFTEPNNICSIRLPILHTELIVAKKTFETSMRKFTSICIEESDAIKSIVERVRDINNANAATATADTVADCSIVPILTRHVSDLFKYNANLGKYDISDFLRQIEKIYTDNPDANLAADDITTIINAIMRNPNDGGGGDSGDGNGGDDEVCSKEQYMMKVYIDYNKLISIKRMIAELAQLKSKLIDLQDKKAGIASMNESLNTRRKRTKSAFDVWIMSGGRNGIADAKSTKPKYVSKI